MADSLAEVIAERAFTSRPTVRRIEAGDTGVSIGIYAAVLHALGFLDGLEQLADPRGDEAGLAMAAAALPKRTRLRRHRYLTMTADIEVFIDFAAGLKRVGTLHRQVRRGTEAMSFEISSELARRSTDFSPAQVARLNDSLRRRNTGGTVP